MKTLLVNIGNRNLVYKKLFLPNYLRKNNLDDSVYNFSKNLLEKLDEEKQHFSIAILDEMINKNRSEVDKVVLFGSDQPERTRKDQDTIYIARIISKLLTDNFNDIETVVEPIRCEITDNNKLLKYYKSFFSQRLDENPGEHFVICDAGGTAQQKSSLKIMAEFMLKESQYEVHYVAFDGEKSVWKLIPQVEYRKVITGKQIISLIAMGEYNGALNLQTNFTPGLEMKGYNFLLAFAHFRIQMLTDDAGKLIRRLPPKKFKTTPLLSDYSVKKPLSGNKALLGLLKPDDLFMTSELLSIVQFYLDIKNYSQAVLFLSRFVERYLNSFISLKGYDLIGSNYEKAYSDLIKDLKKEQNKSLLESVEKTFKTLGIQTNNKLIKGVPLSLAYCALYDENDTHKKLMCLFFELYKPNRLGSLRNRYAHEGRGIKEKDFKPLQNPTLKIIEIYNLPEKNIYQQINEIIAEKL